MNLQEILSYRDRCIHCDRSLVMQIAKYPKLSITQNDEGLKIRSGHKDGIYLNFGFDGTYQRNKRNYKIYAGPVYIEKRCMLHPLIGPASFKMPPLFTTPAPAPILLKSRSTGMTSMSSALNSYFGTSIDNMKDITCCYEFSLFGDSQGNYDVNMKSEFIYTNDGNEFWHVNTWFNTNNSQIYHGTYDQSLNEILRLKVPAVNLSGVKNKNQLIEKLKLYTLFS